MKNLEIPKEYLRISDAMLQALKARRYDMFIKLLDDRGQLLIDNVGVDSNWAEHLTKEEKKYYYEHIQKFEKLIEVAMSEYRSELESELLSLQVEKSKLRKRSQVRNYYGTSSGNHGVFIDGLK